MVLAEEDALKAELLHALPQGQPFVERRRRLLRRDRLSLGVRRVQEESLGGITTLTITTDTPREVIPRLCALAGQQGWRVREVRQQKQTLEDLFVQIVGANEGADEVVAV